MLELYMCKSQVHVLWNIVINTCGTRSTGESADPASNLRNMKSLPKRNYQYCHYLPITRTSFAMPNAVSVAVSNTSHVYELSTRQHIPVNSNIGHRGGDDLQIKNLYWKQKITPVHWNIDFTLIFFFLVLWMTTCTSESTVVNGSD